MSDSPWLTVHVYGDPETQGSYVPGVTREGRPYARPFNMAALTRWRDEIATAAGFKLGDREALAGPVRVRLDFYLFPGRGKRPPDGPAYETAPDIDKLARAVLDALTGARAWRDDKQVVELTLTKRWVGLNRQASGVEITVDPIDA